MSEPTLFDLAGRPATEAHARGTDPATSHAAAASITEDDLRASQRAVLAVLRRYGPGDFATITKAYDTARYFDPDAHPNQSDSGLRTRVAELVDARLVCDSGERVTLPSGRQAIVWAATS